MSWLRRSFITGFFVTVPLIISVAALVWIFQVVDSVTEPLSVRLLGRAVPGLGVLMTAGIILVVGAVATNVIGKRVLQRAESYLLRVPVFRTIYAPVKQLVVAFSPDNEYGFKRVVLLEDPSRGYPSASSPRSSCWSGAARPSRWWRSTCPPIISISVMSSSVTATRPPTRTSPWSRGSGSS
jgi:uncharacterized membrane protein